MNVTTYQYPEEECNLESVLKEDEMDQVEDQAGSMEPEMIIWRLNHQLPFDGCMFLGNFVG